MLDFSKEAQLLTPVFRFLKNKYVNPPCKELSFYRYNIDLFTYSKDMEAVSVELKLIKWKKALQQALIYQLCSDYVYIAMPKTKINKKILQELQPFGVGVIAVDSSGHCRITLKPSKSKVINMRYKTESIKKAQGIRKK